MKQFFSGLSFLVVLLSASNLLAQETRLFSTSINQATKVALLDSGVLFRERGDGPAVLLSLPFPSGAIDVSLEPHELRSSKYKSSQNLGAVNSADTSLYFFRAAEGVESADYFARFTLSIDSDDSLRLKGFVLHEGNFYELSEDEEESSTYHVGELSRTAASRIALACGSEHDHAKSAHSSAAPLLLPEAARSATTAEATFKIIELATDADFEYVTAEGSAAAANATILSILNAVDAIYQSELGIAISVVYQNTWTTISDPYTTSDSSDLLSEFRAYWQTNFSSSVTYDLAHLWTGRDLDGSTAGIAFLNAACGGSRYGLSQRFNSMATDVPLVAHELGHNVGSDHDMSCSNSSWIMCAFLQSNADTFSPAAKSQVASFLTFATCIEEGDVGPSNASPVLDPIGPQSVTETATLTLTLSGSDEDTDDVVSFSFSPAVSGASLSGSLFSYTPPQGTVPGGSADTQVSITFTASDGNGGVDSEIVVVTVDKSNRAPSLDNPGSQFINEGDGWGLQLTGSDPDSDPLSFEAIGSFPTGAFVSSSGLLTWRPAGDQQGVYTFQVRASDGFGGDDTATFSVDVSDSPGVLPMPDRHAAGDFDGDGNSDLAVFRNISGDWFYGSTADVGAGALSQQQFGLPGDIPIPADYNGDRVTDLGLFRPSTATWYVRYSFSGQVVSTQFGVSSDIPMAADFDADGRADLGLFRPDLGVYTYLSSMTGNQVTKSINSEAGDIPVPCNYDGSAGEEMALFRPAEGLWRLELSSTQNISLGSAKDIPIPADYDGDGSCDIAVWEPDTGNWVSQAETVQYGLAGDIPGAYDFNGDGVIERTVFRPASTLWFVRSSASLTDVYQLGLPTDEVATREQVYRAYKLSATGSALASGDGTQSVGVYDPSFQRFYPLSLTIGSGFSVPASSGSYVLRGDYDGDGAADTAVYFFGFWNIFFNDGSSDVRVWGNATDIPVSGDFDGDGSSDLAIYRPDNGGGFAAWYVVSSRTGAAMVSSFGLTSDTPIAADFNGDGWTDYAVFRSSLGRWFVADARSGALIEDVQWGLPGDVLLATDYDLDGRADKVVWRNGWWFIRYSSGGANAIAWGLPGDVPVPGSYSGSGFPDYAVWRSSDATLYVRSVYGATVAATLGYGGAPAGVTPSAPLP